MRLISGITGFSQTYVPSTNDVPLILNVLNDFIKTIDLSPHFAYHLVVLGQILQLLVYYHKVEHGVLVVYFVVVVHEAPELLDALVGPFEDLVDVEGAQIVFNAADVLHCGAFYVAVLVL